MPNYRKPEEESLQWFRMHLENRKQLVTLNGILENGKQIEFEVSQKSVLKPVLFVLYVKRVHNLNVNRSYAHDTGLIFYSY